jgi:hypothetical protein
MHHWLILHLGIDASWQKDGFGYVASALVLCTFSVTSMRTLRCLAIASNVSFMLYATISGTTPILILHGLLLPNEHLSAGSDSSAPDRQSHLSPQDVDVPARLSSMR